MNSVSRETIREALRGLESEGLIARHRGKGAFVARLPDTTQDERLTGVAEGFTELKLDTEVEVLKTGLEAIPSRVAAALRLDRGERLFRIQRLRTVDGEPLGYWDQASCSCRSGFSTPPARPFAGAEAAREMLDLARPPNAPMRSWKYSAND
jgi:Bacterial regulatory proteins, gntR family/UTRA domain